MLAVSVVSTDYPGVTLPPRPIERSGCAEPGVPRATQAAVSPDPWLLFSVGATIIIGAFLARWGAKQQGDKDS